MPIFRKISPIKCQTTRSENTKPLTLALIALWSDTPQEFVTEVAEGDGVVGDTLELMSVDLVHLLFAETSDKRAFLLLHETMATLQLNKN